MMAPMMIVMIAVMLAAGHFGFMSTPMHRDSGHEAVQSQEQEAASTDEARPE